MHVKLVVNSFPTTSETFIFNLVTGLESKGIKVTVCALSEKNNKELYKDRIHEWSGNIEVLPLNSKFILGIFSILRIVILNPKTAKKCISQFGIKRGLSITVKAVYLVSGKPDIVHFVFSGIGVNFLDAIQIVSDERLKIFISCRGTAEKVKPITDPLRKKQLIKLFQSVHKTHCVSKDMLESLLKYGLIKEKAFINYPSINLDLFKRETPYNYNKKDKWQLLTTGTLNYLKGYVFSFLALKILKDKGYCFTYNILGDGPDKDTLRYFIHELGLEGDVILHGKVSSDKVKKELIKSDIFILPSISEGVANAALEAMAMQIPTVTTTAGGMCELIDHRINGMLVDRFSPSSLAKAIEELFESTSLRQRISANSRTTIKKNFNSNNQIIKFINEYKKACQ